MNIVRENRDGRTALIKVNISEADYGPEVEKKLKEYRRKANIPGFRPGMAPMGVVNRLYRKGTVAEVAYKTASDACFDYLQKEKIDYMGDVLPSDEQGKLDFDNNTDFEFAFETGIAPEVNVELTDKDKVTRYKIKVDDTMRERFRENFMRRFGGLVDVDEVTKDEAVTGTLDNGEMRVEDAYIGLISMNDEERKPYIGKKVGDELSVNIEELYKSESQRAAVLGVKQPELKNIAPEFKFKVDRIRKFAEPQLDAEFFKKAFPEGNVTDKAGFDKYVDSQIEESLSSESGIIFNADLREMLIDKADLTLPDAFLKKWLHTINEGKFTMEQIDADYENFARMMRWNLVRKYFVDKLEIKVEQDDLLAEAKRMATNQFAQYGMTGLDDETITNYARSMLANREQANQIVENTFDLRVIDAVTPLVKVASKSVSEEELEKILEKKA